MDGSPSVDVISTGQRASLAVSGVTSLKLRSFTQAAPHRPPESWTGPRAQVPPGTRRRADSRLGTQLGGAADRCICQDWLRRRASAPRSEGSWLMIRAGYLVLLRIRTYSRGTSSGQRSRPIRLPGPPRPRASCSETRRFMADVPRRLPSTGQDSNIQSPYLATARSIGQVAPIYVSPRRSDLRVA